MHRSLCLPFNLLPKCLTERPVVRRRGGCSPLRKGVDIAGSTFNLLRGEVFDIAIAMTANTDNARGHAYANEALPKLEQAFTQALRALLTHQPASDPVEWCARWLLRGISEKLGADAFCAQTPTIAQGQGTAAWQSPRLTGSPTRRLTPCIPPLPLGKLRWNDINFEPSSFSERASYDSSTACSQQLSLRDEPVAEVQEPLEPGAPLGSQLFDKGVYVRHGPTRLPTRAVPMLGPIADHLNYLVPSPSLFQQTRTAAASTDEEEHAKVAAGGEHAKGGELPPTPVPSAEEVEAGAPAVAPGPAAASAAATSAEAGAAAAERAPDGATAQTERPPRDSQSHIEETEDRREPPMAVTVEDVAAAEVVAETVAEAVAEALAKAVALHTWTG